MGEKLRFYLSLGLFSSFNVDAGTRLLLKTLAQQKIIPQSGSILDSGCGTGVIAISLKKRFPQLSVTAADRDALALKFTRKNAALNKLGREGFEVIPGFLPGGYSDPFFPAEKCAPGTFDLIISNIPAKAGGPVIDDFITGCGRWMKNGGIAAVVIVSTLAEAAAGSIEKSGAELLYQEANDQYSVFHFRPAKETKAESDFTDVYVRTRGEVDGFWGLPDFDSTSYQTSLMLKTLRKFRPDGSTVIWNPGTGHIARTLTETAGNRPALTLSGNDLLQLKASAHSCHGAPPALLHLPDFPSILEHLPDDSADCVIASPVMIPGAEIEKELMSTASRLLKKKGRLFAAGRSSDIAKLERYKKGFSELHSIKYRGFRLLLLEKLS